jgi:hypothetical protein
MLGRCGDAEEEGEDGEEEADEEADEEAGGWLLAIWLLEVSEEVAPRADPRLSVGGPGSSDAGGIGADDCELVPLAEGACVEETDCVFDASSGFEVRCRRGRSSSPPELVSGAMGEVSTGADAAARS